MDTLSTSEAPSYKERFRRLRKKQENAFVSIFFHRPLAILMLLPVTEVKAITPNGITTVSILMRLVAAAMLWPAEWGGIEDTPAVLWTVVVLWNVGGTLDAADGALARYRGKGSAFGAFYDKVSDRLLTLSFMLSLSARSMVATGDVRYVYVAMIYVAMMTGSSVAKWIEIGIMAGRNESGFADEIEREAPPRTPAEWVKYWLWSLRTIFVITEMDMPLWGSIAILTGLEHWLFYYIAVITVPYAIIAISIRGRRLYKLDQAVTTGAAEEGPAG